MGESFGRRISVGFRPERALYTSPGQRPGVRIKIRVPSEDDGKKGQNLISDGIENQKSKRTISFAVCFS